MKEVLSSYRCSCNKMLLKGFIFVGEVEIKCRFCKKVVTISGVNGNLSNEHRYIFLAREDGSIRHASSSAAAHLGYSAQELEKLRVHELIAFKEAYYGTLWKRLSDKPQSYVLFQTKQVGKNGKKATVQVGVRVFTTSMNEKLFIFDVETRKPRRTFPKSPAAGQASLALAKK